MDPEETRHLARVLRLGVGARVEVCDGRGRNVEARITELDPEGAQLRVLRELAFWGESPLRLVLGIGLAKGEALDGVVRQATEMGVQRLIPFVSERSERVTPERAGRRRERWQRLTREMIKSCQRSVLPEIEAVQDFAGILAGSEEVKLIFWEEERGGGLQSLLARPRPGAVRVLGAGKLVGICTKRNCAHKPGAAPGDKTAGPRYSTGRVMCVSPHQMVGECMAIMTHNSTCGICR